MTAPLWVQAVLVVLSLIGLIYLEHRLIDKAFNETFPKDPE